MKQFILLLLALILWLCPGAVRAADVLFDLGAVQVLLPLSQVDGVYVYDLAEDNPDKASRWGLETPLTVFRLPAPGPNIIPLTITFGATTDTVRRGDPLVGIHIPVAQIVNGPINIGFATGYRFSDSEWIYGFKASRPIFGHGK